MTLTNVKGNTWVADGPQLIGIYVVNETQCVILDPGSGKLQADLDETIRSAGWTPVGVICTHMHYDHHEGTRYFREKYGALSCLPQLEADIVRSEQSLKNHLYNFTMGLIRTYPRLQALIGPVDRVIEFGETEIDFCGAKFGIVRTPGHSPDHICIVTPDNVCFAGDTLMTEEVLKDSMVPFVYDMVDDLASKELMKTIPCDIFIFCHKGLVYGSVADLAQANIDRIHQQLAAITALVDKPMTYSEFYAAVVTEMDLPVGHPHRAQHLERYIRPYLEYLVDTGAIELIELGGAPAVQPVGYSHE